MRHRRTRRRIQRNFSHRKQLLENLVSQLLTHQEIRTTWVKAKETQRLADRVITLGKSGSLAARRRAFAILGNRDLTCRLFESIAPRFNDRKGGYTRVLHMGHRRGDAAPMALLELTEKEALSPKKPAAKKEKASTTAEKPAAKPRTAPESRPAPPMKKQAAPPQKKGFLSHVRRFFRKKGDS